MEQKAKKNFLEIKNMIAKIEIENHPKEPPEK